MSSSHLAPPPPNCAETDGYVDDVRTGKKYTLYGEETTFFKDIDGMEWNGIIYILFLSHHNSV
jgi:hypothetical protein